MNEDDFKITKGFKSYINKPEITDIGPNFLVKASKNVLIDYASRVISRNGYTRYNQINTGGTGIKSGYKWDTSTAKFIDIRVHNGQIEFDWNGTYNLLKGGFATSFFKFDKIWDNTEKIDVLLGVYGQTNTIKWSGAVSKIKSSTATTITKQGVLTSVNTIAFIAGTPGSIAPTITDSAMNFLNAGFASGDTLYVTGSTANSRNFTIASVTAGTITLIMSDTITSEAAGTVLTIHNGEPTWATSRFLTTGTRKIVYQGVEYTYTGGEATDTLTGLTAFPIASVGDVTWQALIILSNPVDIPASFKQDLIGVQLNQVIYASTKSREIYISSINDYTNFALTSPRAPGDPAKLTMDNYCTCIVPVDNQDQSFNSLMFGGGTSEFFQLTYKLAQDNTTELIKMIKLKTAIGSGLISGDAITPIKNATAYISREPSLDTLGNVENKEGSQNVPISDLIKNDFDHYNFTGTDMIYWKRAIYISLPVHGLVLIYDQQRSLWQPPQSIPVGVFTIINDWLYGHSSVTNETYRLFTGTDDNGIFIPQVARFSYNNGGRRDRVKNMSQYWTDGYITANGVLNLNMNLGFNGSVAKKVLTISGNDISIVIPQTGSPLGDESLGSNPLGGASFESVAGLAGEVATMLRFYQSDDMKAGDYVEHYVEYTMNTLGGQFAVVGHGSNQWDAGTSLGSHKK